MESTVRSTTDVNLLQVETSDHLTIPIQSTDDKTLTKIDHKDPIKKKRCSCFQWFQLLATICIPVLIAIYTIVESNSNTSIADQNRRKDLEIAQANRLNELTIAERSREKDRELALDQQRETILIEYQTFLAKLIIENGITLNKTPAAKVIARSMTVTALSQLDPIRQSIVLRSLTEMRLINLERNSKPLDISILELTRVDLSNTTFSLSRHSSDDYPDLSYNYWTYLYLPETILTNASFRYVFLDCSTFSNCRMDSVDLSFANIRISKCFTTHREIQTDFSSTSLINASLYKAIFRNVHFSKAKFIWTNMRYFDCVDCTFTLAIFIQADLSYSKFITIVLKKQIAGFFSTQLREVVAHSATFQSMNFTNSNWSNVQASEILLRNCTFSYVTMNNCSFMKSTIEESTFRNATLYDIDFSDSRLTNVSFINADIRHANFSSIKCISCQCNNAQLHGIMFTNASFRYSNFLNARINNSQFQEIIDLTGTTLPNGTIVR